MRGISSEGSLMRSMSRRIISKGSGHQQPRKLACMYFIQRLLYHKDNFASSRNCAWLKQRACRTGRRPRHSVHSAMLGKAPRPSAIVVQFNADSGLHYVPMYVQASKAVHKVASPRDCHLVRVLRAFVHYLRHR